MGLDTRRPPLPAPTDASSLDDTTSALGTDVVTNVSKRTDKTSYSVPEDGRAITINTEKARGNRDHGLGGHRRKKSQTSLLIEYFEAAKKGDNVKSKPSVRVRVTPSSKKRRGDVGEGDSVKITGIGKDRKPSYTRRISLGSSRQAGAGAHTALEGTEVSQSSGSNLSGQPPIEVEVMGNDSELSTGKSSRGLLYAQNESNISSLPPESMLEGSEETQRSRSIDRIGDEESLADDGGVDHLKAPTRSRSRSLSRERITQKVMEKLGQQQQQQQFSKPRKSSKSSNDRSTSRDYDYSRERRRRSSKSNQLEGDAVSGAESSLLSKPTDSQLSYRSGTSQGSRISNNPKLLEMVEDTIKRMILPEIDSIRENQRTDRNNRSYKDKRSASIPIKEGYEPGSVERTVSKSSSTPNITGRPKVVLNQDGDDPGTVLSRGDSERVKSRKSSRDNSERPSSRRSSGGRRSSYGYDDEESVRHKSSKSSRGLRDVAAAGAAGAAGGALTSAALKHHESQSDTHDTHEKRKKRSKSRSSRSRSASIAETTEDAYGKEREAIPPMPMASRIGDSDLTRDSILSSATEGQESTISPDIRTPIREVSRGSLGEAMSPSSARTPTGDSPGGLGMSHANRSLDSPNSISNRARLAGLAAAGLGGATLAKGVSDHRDRQVDADGYGTQSPRRDLGSPAQSVSSLRKQYDDDPLIPSGLRPRSAASRSSGGHSQTKHSSKTSLKSTDSSPRNKLTKSRKTSDQTGGDEFVTPMEAPQPGTPGYIREGTRTPNGESVDEWYDRQHAENDRYRNSLDDETTNRDSYQTNSDSYGTNRGSFQSNNDSYQTNRDSYQTNPYPEDSKRFTNYTDESYDEGPADKTSSAQNLQGVGANPEYVHTPQGVESNVASLVGPSTVDGSGLQSSLYSEQGKRRSGTEAYSDRMSEHLRDMGHDEDKSAMYEGSTASQNEPSQNRWSAIKNQAKALSSASDASPDRVAKMSSPQQSPARSMRDSRSMDESPVRLGASGIPVADDPLPEIGHYDSKSDLTTNPSIIQGPLGGEASGKGEWPYTPSPHRSTQKELSSRGSRESKSAQSQRSGHGNGTALLGAAAAGAAGLAAGHAMRKKTSNTSSASGYSKGREAGVEDGYDYDRRSTPSKSGQGYEIDREQTPTSAVDIRDEGYVTDARGARSVGAITPKGEQHQYGRNDIEEFNRTMDAQDLGDEEDPFVGNETRPRHLSGDSHGMAPTYDSATGQGKDHIESKDIVALMDHLTVRDAQRNARDTEILVTLVRSAAEMRQNFDEMKRYIAEQDKLIMQNTDRGADMTIKQVLGGPRPQPSSSPRTSREQAKSYNSQEDVQTKRKGMLRRALKGLTGGKSHNDLAKVEDMLMQILDNVEDLKHQGVPRQPMDSYASDSLNSYEQLRNAPDSGYEPEGHAGTNSTPSNSGHFAMTPRSEKQQFHSGYNGRPGSENRVSTVHEDDEDELEPHEINALNHQFENNERMITPTQESFRNGQLSPTKSSPRFNAQPQELTPRSADKQRKHTSSGSSAYGAPKVSRWSKTTSSSAAPDSATLDSSNLTRNAGPQTAASRSGSSLGQLSDERYSLQDDDRLRSTQSLAREQETRSVRSQASRLTRTPSPLIPSEASYSRSFDDEGPQTSPEQHDSDYAFDDPKYQAHRNSLLLQHPQPRAGPTPRHQNTLESQAQQYDGPPGTDSDLSQRTVSDFDPATWGSSGTAALARNRFVEPDVQSPGSKDDGPLFPQKSQPSRQQPQQPQQQTKPQRREYEDDEEEDWQPQYSNSGYAKNPSRMYYTSPLGSGHLLEPIEEVRYSLETDSGHLSPEPGVSASRATNGRSASNGGARKITGPRPMGSPRSPQPQAQTSKREQPRRENNGLGTVRRKPVRGTSFDSETF
ncbi:hypothetical protein MBLNU230_g4052t1 [Neophaeotheca triangularis]